MNLKTLQGYEKNVFLNCPLDSEYQPLLRPILFTILKMGFNPRLALERADSSESRLNKIFGLIGTSRYGIHDLSRCIAKKKGEVFRLNMPFELGLDFASKHYSKSNRDKKILVLEEQRYRFAKALSDIAGSDIKDHQGIPSNTIQQVRDWFVETDRIKNAPSAQAIWYEFNECMSSISAKRQSEKVPESEAFNVPVNELLSLFKTFMKMDD